MVKALYKELTIQQFTQRNFTETNTKFCLTLHYNRSNSYLFINRKEIHKFKTKDSEIIAAPLCLESISKDFSVDNMRNTGLK